VSATFASSVTNVVHVVSERKKQRYNTVQTRTRLASVLLSL
jgi:hypothetical protein